MTGPRVIRALVVDNDPSLIEDYRYILCPRSENVADRLFAKLEDDLFGSAVRHRGFPEIDISAFQQGRDAVEAVRDAVEDGRPFAVAFIDLHMPPGLDGLQTAEQIRALDPDIQIVIASVHCDIHPVEMSERIPPAEQLYYLRKPFHSIELQQLMLALGARWRSEHSFSGGGRTAVGVTSWRGHSSMAETLQQLPAAILVFDRRDRLLSANDEAAKLFPELAEFFVPGTRYEEIQRQMALQLLPKDTLYRVESWIGDRLEWHARSGGILEQRLRGSRWVLLVEGAAPSGETYCMYYDITDLKRRETNRATTNHMTQMAQSFAALCQRLETISRAAREEQERGSARRRPEMQVAHLSGRWAAGGRDGPVQSLTAQLQAVAQCQSLKPESVGLNRIVGEVVRQMRGELPTAVDLEVIAGAGLWPVLIDKVQFAVALSELIRNAAEAMSAGGRLIVETTNLRLTREFVALRTGLSAGEYVRVSVQDTGPGMSPELADRALNPFFTSKGQDGHLGLGLSAAYGFANQSGGHIEIDGGEGRGVTIDLYFPRAEEVTTESLDEDASAEASEGGPVVRPAASKGRF